MSNRYFGSTLEEIQEEISAPRDPETLSPNQKAVYDSISFPRKMKTLYKVHKQLMPDSSVRRILHSLKHDKLARKNEKGKWVRL